MLCVFVDLVQKYDGAKLYRQGCQVRVFNAVAAWLPQQTQGHSNMEHITAKIKRSRSLRRRK